MDKFDMKFGRTHGIAVRRGRPEKNQHREGDSSGRRKGQGRTLGHRTRNPDTGHRIHTGHPRGPGVDR